MLLVPLANAESNMPPLVAASAPLPMAIARSPVPEVAIAVSPAVGNKSIPSIEICISSAEAVPGVAASAAVTNLTVAPTAPSPHPATP